MEDLLAKNGFLVELKNKWRPRRRPVAGQLKLYSRAANFQSSAVIESGEKVRSTILTSETRFPSDLAGGVDTAIRRSQDFLLSEQKPEGYWVGELMVDSTLVSDTVAYHHWNGKVDPEWQRKAVNHIFSMQLPDGGWNIYHGGPSEVNATIKAYLALKLAGVSVKDPRLLKAREMALHFGGVPRMNTFSKLYLALIGLYPWEYVPTIPCEVLLIGKWFHVNFWDMSNWSRAMLVPLAIINHFKPTRPVKVNLDELYPEGYHERDLALSPDPEKISFRNFFLWLDRLHKLAEWFAEHGIHPFRRAALKKAEKWMLERFEGSDGLAAIFPAMLNSLIALKALGYADDHPEVVRAAHELKKLEHEEEDSVRIEPCFSPVWDTAIVAICLRESGVPADHPKLKLAAEYLMEKEIRFAGDWIHKNPAKVEPSGWVFEYNNKWNPDVDDTAMVLLALRKIPTDNPRRRDECFQRGLKWMMTFQCKDGGWAAFDRDCTKNILEKVPFADHNAMLDPECADITARILELLGYEELGPESPPDCGRARLRPPPAGGGRLVVWPLGRELHLRHLAGAARNAGAEPEHEGRLASARPRLAGKRPARRRRLGRTLQHLRRSGFQRPGAEHRVANRLGRHGPVRV